MAHDREAGRLLCDVLETRRYEPAVDVLVDVARRGREQGSAIVALHRIGTDVSRRALAMLKKELHNQPAAGLLAHLA